MSDTTNPTPEGAEQAEGTEATVERDAFPFVKRTHSKSELSIRESTILLHLLGKAIGSTPPAGFEAPEGELRNAFGRLGQFAVRCIQEARDNVATLEAMVEAGDADAQVDLDKVRKALADVRKQQKAGKLDDLLLAAREASASA